MKDLKLLGSCGQDDKVDLLYLLTKSAEDEKSLNTAQIAGAILGHSRYRERGGAGEQSYITILPPRLFRTIFYTHLVTLLNYLNPALCELSYVDTDSAIWFCKVGISEIRTAFAEKFIISKRQRDS